MFFLYFLPPARKACTIPDPEPLLHTQNSSRGEAYRIFENRLDGVIKVAITADKPQKFGRQ